MSSKHRKSFIVLSLMAAILFTSVSAQETKKSKPEPLVIQEQGSFAVGGKVITAPGTFDPIKQGAYNPAGTDPAGQTLHDRDLSLGSFWIARLVGSDPTITSSKQYVRD